MGDMNAPEGFFTKYWAYIEKYRAYELRLPDDIFAEILQTCDYLDDHDKEMLRASYRLAQLWHTNQLRKSGSPYITHPLIVAVLMLPHKPSAVLLSAALLHDILEDTTIPLKKIQKIHPDIAEIVKWVTKIVETDEKNTPMISLEQARQETIKKIFVTSHTNFDILILKIFDRLHNMLTIDSMSLRGRQRVSYETQTIFMPLAKRIWLQGMYELFYGLTMEVLDSENWGKKEHFFKKNPKILSWWMKVNNLEQLQDLEKLYFPILQKDLAIMYDIPDSETDTFVNCLVHHVLAQKICLHSTKKEDFYLPMWSTMLDAIVYLEPEKFHMVSKVTKNTIPVTLDTELCVGDEISYTFSIIPTYEKRWSKCTNSYYTQWKLNFYSATT